MKDKYIQKFKPYLLKKGKEAIEFLNTNPLDISESMAEYVDLLVMTKNYNELEKSYDN